MIMQFRMLNNRCQLEERSKVFAFLLLRALLPQSSHFFRCHGSGNRSLSFSHAGCMLMWDPFLSIIWSGREGSQPQSAMALDTSARLLRWPGALPTLPSAQLMQQVLESRSFYSCLLTYQLQSATELLTRADPRFLRKETVKDRAHQDSDHI